MHIILNFWMQSFAGSLLYCSFYTFKYAFFWEDKDIDRSIVIFIWSNIFIVASLMLISKKLLPSDSKLSSVLTEGIRWTVHNTMDTRWKDCQAYISVHTPWLSVSGRWNAPHHRNINSDAQNLVFYVILCRFYVTVFSVTNAFRLGPAYVKMRCTVAFMIPNE